MHVYKFPNIEVCYYTSRQSTNNQILATLRPYIETRNFSMEGCSWVIFTIWSSFLGSFNAFDVKSLCCIISKLINMVSLKTYPIQYHPRNTGWLLLNWLNDLFSHNGCIQKYSTLTVSVNVAAHDILEWQENIYNKTWIRSCQLGEDLRFFLILLQCINF